MKSRNQILKETGHFIIELIIVFIGVYLAFLLSEHRLDSEIQNRRKQMRLALSQEIGVFINSTDTITPFLDSLLTQWQNKYKAGKDLFLYIYSLPVLIFPREGCGRL